MMARDTIQYLLDNIDDNLKSALISILNGEEKKISVKIRKRVQASVRIILEG